MKTIISIACLIVGFIAIPISLGNIIEDNRRCLFLVLLLLQLPGFIISANHLFKKYPN